VKGLIQVKSAQRLGSGGNFAAADHIRATAAPYFQVEVTKRPRRLLRDRQPQRASSASSRAFNVRFAWFNSLIASINTPVSRP
jgi:hypothetical protein